MGKTVKPMRILSAGFIKMKVKAVMDRKEKKKVCETYLKQMEAQRLEQKRTRSSVEDTDESIRYLKAEIAHLSS